MGLVVVLGHRFCGLLLRPEATQQPLAVGNYYKRLVIIALWYPHARRDKSDRKGEEPYAFAHVRDTEQNATKKTNKQTHRHRRRHGGQQRGSGVGGGDEEGQRGQISGNGRFDRGW